MVVLDMLPVHQVEATSAAVPVSYNNIGPVVAGHAQPSASRQSFLDICPNDTVPVVRKEPDGDPKLADDADSTPFVFGDFLNPKVGFLPEIPRKSDPQFHLVGVPAI